MPISTKMDFNEIKHQLHVWLSAHYPDVALPGQEPLSPQQLSRYYEHCEIAMLALNWLDLYPDFIKTLRRLKNYTRRLDALTYKKEIFRSKVAFK